MTTTPYAVTWQAHLSQGGEILIDRVTGYRTQGRDYYVKAVRLPTWTGSTAVDWDAALVGRGYERVTDWDQDAAGTRAQVKLVADQRPIATRYRISLLDERTGQWVTVDDEPIVGTHDASKKQPSIYSTPDGYGCDRARVETFAADGRILDTHHLDPI